MKLDVGDMIVCEVTRARSGFWYMSMKDEFSAKIAFIVVENANLSKYHVSDIETTRGLLRIWPDVLDNLTHLIRKR